VRVINDIDILLVAPLTNGFVSEVPRVSSVSRKFTRVNDFLRLLRKTDTSFSSFLRKECPSDLPVFLGDTVNEETK
jgi:hypothetical protein